MLYLIGGPPRCGKTTLSNAVAKKLGIPYFSIDHITSVIPPCISPELQDESFPLRALLQQVNNDNDRFFEAYSAEKIVQVYQRQAATCWPGIKNFIQYAIEDEHNLVLEGWQILPYLLNEIPTVKRRDRVQLRYLYKTDVEEILSGLKANDPASDWVLKHTKEEVTFKRIAQVISRFGKILEEQAGSLGFQAINVETGFSDKIASFSNSFIGYTQSPP